jgi:hypothetical protein
MNELIENLIEKSKSDKKGLIALKNAAVTLQSFDLAAKLHDIEIQYFPKSDEEKLDKELNTLFGMVGIKFPIGMAYKVHETLKVWINKKGDFSLEDSVSIVERCKELFIEE